ncbi:hypothetical protein AAG594_02960 [Citromicrobium bathyomarinum]
MAKAAFPDRFGRYRLGADGVLRKPQGGASSPTVAIVTLRPRKGIERAKVSPTTPPPSGDVVSKIRAIIADSAESTPPPASQSRPPVRSKYGPGERRPAKKGVLPDIPFHLRKRNIDEATVFLKRHAILVDVVNRDSLVRMYRVSGKRDALLAEEVIEIACNLGFEVIQ